MDRYVCQLLEHSDDIPVVVLTLHIGNNIVGRSIGFQYSQLDDIGPGLEEMESDLQYLWLKFSPGLPAGWVLPVVGPSP